MATATLFVPAPSDLLEHPECRACGACLVCEDPHRCPARPEPYRAASGDSSKSHENMCSASSVPGEIRL
jgi:hypothetical protein